MGKENNSHKGPEAVPLGVSVDDSKVSNNTDTIGESTAKKRWFKYIIALTALVIAMSVVGVGIFKLVNHSRAVNETGIHKIKHIVVIMQENRSFDSYFGTFPGADGIPMQNGVPTVCAPDPANGNCVKPYHDTNDKNSGGPHGQTDATAAINGGKMDGFIGLAEKALKNCAPNDPACAGGVQTDVMGYHTAAEIPNYWTYAKDFTLQDRMFEPNASWSLPEHLFMVSEWSAKCSPVSTNCKALVIPRILIHH